MASQAKRSWWGWGACADAPERDVRNLQRFARWSLAWAVSFVAATFVLAGGVSLPGAAALAVAIVPTLVGAAALAAYTRYLRAADELQQRVQLEALAMGFGVGVLFSMGYRLFERLGAPDLDINDPLIVMLVVWAGWQVVAARRYR